MWKKCLIIIVGVLAVWVTAARHFRPHCFAVPPAKMYWINLMMRAQTLVGITFTEEELELRTKGMPLESEVNRYQYSIRYFGPTNWAVRLSPEKAEVLTSHLHGVERLIYLDFSNIAVRFPDVEISFSGVSYRKE